LQLNNLKTITAFAPATSANLAVGFDLLGFALDNIGDKVTLTCRNDEQIKIKSINANEELPTAIKKNVASAVILNAKEKLDLNIGFDINIEKGIPLGSGMGGSAASAVAALTALNAFLENPLPKHKLAELALYGEKIATGTKHPDNVVPCIFGGLTLTRSIKPISVIELPIPKLHCVIVHPNLRLDTKDSRKVLTEPFPLDKIVKQTANLASLIAALYTDNMDLLKKSLEDVLIEPRRAKLVPNFYHVKNAALANGAIGASLSGSGPSMFALAEDETRAINIANAMVLEFKRADIDAQYWISKISSRAASIL